MRLLRGSYCWTELLWERNEMEKGAWGDYSHLSEQLPACPCADSIDTLCLPSPVFLLISSVSLTLHIIFFWTLWFYSVKTNWRSVKQKSRLCTEFQTRYNASNASKCHDQYSISDILQHELMSIHVGFRRRNDSCVPCKQQRCSAADNFNHDNYQRTY